MLQARSDLYLSQEALGTQIGGQVGVKHLDRDGGLVLQVLGAVHGGHPAATDLSLKRVTVGERRAESIQEIGHSETR
jgi:hypothetical protein